MALAHPMTPPPEDSDMCPLEKSTVPVIAGNGPATPESHSKELHRSHPIPKRKRIRADRRIRSSVTPNFIFPPRPYEAIHIEGAYLADCSRKQYNKYTSLEQDLDSIESQLQNAETDKARKKRLGKKRSLLRGLMMETEKQTGAVTNGLVQVVQELQYPGIWQIPIMETQSYFASSSSEYTSYPCIPESLLNPLSPVFIPGSFPRGQTEHAGSTIESVLQAGVPDTACEDRQDFSCNHNLEYEYRSNEDEDELLYSIDGEIILSRERRLSLPALASLWSGKEVDD